MIISAASTRCSPLLDSPLENQSLLSLPCCLSLSLALTRALISALYFLSSLLASLAARSYSHSPFLSLSRRVACTPPARTSGAQTRYAMSVRPSVSSRELKLAAASTLRLVERKVGSFEDPSVREFFSLSLSLLTHLFNSIEICSSDSLPESASTTSAASSRGDFRRTCRVTRSRVIRETRNTRYFRDARPRERVFPGAPRR